MVDLNEPDGTAPPAAPLGAPPEVSAAEFRAGFGEDLQRTLDLDTWSPGAQLAQAYQRLEAEVRDAVAREDALLRRIRADIFPRLSDYPGAPPSAGVYRADPHDLERVHRGLLFNGGVEACDGTRQTHDTLPLTIYQIGISLVSYQGSQGAWTHRLFRRDLRVGGDPTTEVVELLERRERRAGLNQASRRDALSDLAQRGIMAYAERAILLRRSQARWRLGHGSPAPYELVTGSGSIDLMIEATRLLRELIERHQRFVFVASEPRNRMLLTIGQALRPLEYAVVGTLRDQIERIVERGSYYMKPTVDTTWDDERLSGVQWVQRFRDTVAPQVVVGLYRATRLAPAHLFYAHQRHVHLAAHLLLADSVLQEHRGFPLLLDLAHHVCSALFGSDTLEGQAATAYADAGAPWRFLSERAGRR